MPSQDPDGLHWSTRLRKFARAVKARLRQIARAARRRSSESAEPPPWFDTAESPWLDATGDVPARCNICLWEGPEFEGTRHSESATCPQCGSIARDRFLFFCLQERNPPPHGAVVLETSPRLGDEYRQAMARWFDYTCSDYDGRLHRGTIDLDLQKIELPTESVDVILTPHVLEHVPDTNAALTEIYRVLKPGGRMLLQVPVLQGETAPPTEPEFHGDDTPVFWRFGYDLTAKLRSAGFDTTVLVPQEWEEIASAGGVAWNVPTSPEFDPEDMLRHVIPDDLTVVANDRTSTTYGFVPGYMFITWECIRPSAGERR